jgi:hypothetical protein
MPETPIGVELEQKGLERVAQAKSDYKTVPGGLPGRSESSEEAGPRPRALKKSTKPTDQKIDPKSKDKAREGGKKDPQ